MCEKFMIQREGESEGEKEETEAPHKVRKNVFITLSPSWKFLITGEGCCHAAH